MMSASRPYIAYSRCQISRRFGARLLCRSAPPNRPTDITDIALCQVSKLLGECHLLSLLAHRAL